MTADARPQQHAPNTDLLRGSEESKAHLPPAPMTGERLHHREGTRPRAPRAGGNCVGPWRQDLGGDGSCVRAPRGRRDMRGHRAPRPNRRSRTRRGIAWPSSAAVEPWRAHDMRSCHLVSARRAASIRILASRRARIDVAGRLTKRHRLAWRPTRPSRQVSFAPDHLEGVIHEGRAERFQVRRGSSDRPFPHKLPETFPGTQAWPRPAVHQAVSSCEFASSYA